MLVALAGWYLLQPLTLLLLPAVIATGADGTGAVIGGAVAAVAPRSTVEVRSNDPRAAKVLIARGQVTFDVVPGARRAPFEVRSGDLVVTTRDARFTAARGSDPYVRVVRGAVEVAAHGSIVQLGAGALWPTPARRPNP